MCCPPNRCYCVPVLEKPDYKEPPQHYPWYPVSGPKCLPCGIDPVTLRRPLIVNDSTFDYRPTSWPGMIMNNQDKKVRYQLINYERPVSTQYVGLLRGEDAGCTPASSIDVDEEGPRIGSKPGWQFRPAIESNTALSAMFTSL